MNNSDLSYNSKPSGMEILASKLKNIIFEYNFQLEEKIQLLDNLKMTIRNECQQLIENVEDRFHNKQIAKFKKMQAMKLMIQEEIDLLELKEAELRKREILAKDLKGVCFCGVM